MKLSQNQSINEGDRAMTFFLRIRHYDIAFGPITLKLEVVQDIVILNICMKFNRTRSIDECASVMT